MRQTHTYVVMEVSEATYKEIAQKLVDAEYSHCFANGIGSEMDMSGIALAPDKASMRRLSSKGEAVAAAAEMLSTSSYTRVAVIKHKFLNHYQALSPLVQASSGVPEDYAIVEVFVRETPRAGSR